MSQSHPDYHRLAASALAGCAGSNFGGGADPGATNSGDPSAEKRPVVIGAVLDITGVGANLGVPEQNTLNLLAEQLNEEGGIVELIIRDNRSTEDGAARVTTELIENEGAHLIIGGSRTGPSTPLRPIVEQALTSRRSSRTSATPVRKPTSSGASRPRSWQRRRPSCSTSRPAVRVPPTEAMCANPELTAHLASEPRGDWIGRDTAVAFGSDGAGPTRSTIDDQTGPIGAL